jgi:preprotein translocase subunit SecA
VSVRGELYPARAGLRWPSRGAKPNMATETKLDVGILEKIGDGFNAFSEGVVKFLGRLLGNSNDNFVRNLGYIRVKDATPPYRVTPGSLLDRINQLEPRMQALSDDELKGLTPKFRERIAKGESLESLLPEAFAACREAGKRTKNMRHFDTQMLGGIVLHRGNIAEMVTGEGKTLVATLPAYLNCLTGQGVHVITVNDYLARRDCEWMLPIFQALGVTAGYIQSDMEAEARRRAYDCDITYGTNSEFGFDYLRDNMKPASRDDERFDAFYRQVQRGLNYAIIDEVDNILIDEARTPLIISGQAFTDIRKYSQANAIAVQLTELERRARSKYGLPNLDSPAGMGADPRKVNDDDIGPAPEADPEGKEKRTGYYFQIKEKEHTCHLTDEGVRKAEELAGVESFYTAGNMEWPHLIDNALKAHHLYKRDRNYMVMDHEGERKIIIIDEFTGRAMFGRQWSDGLHQAVEAKHDRDGVKIKQETQTMATITLQNYFKLYNKLAGMTGTAMTEANEFWKIYKLDVIAIPTNRCLQRINFPDLIYKSAKEKWDAVLEEVERVNRFDTLHFRREDSTHGMYVYGDLIRETETDYEIKLKDQRDTTTFPKNKIRSVERRGRPILIGTTDVAKSEKLSTMLKRRGIKHELLNAKPENVAREAEIVSQAGRLQAVTISTNMAGRGTDIILGGNPETLAWARLKDQRGPDGGILYPTRLEVPEEVWRQTVHDIESKEKMKEEGRKVAELGGLHIVGTERHESRRIDNQLRGRAGRQGDPGSSRFFLSLEDDLMRIFAGEWVKNMLVRLGMEDGQAIESRMVSRQVEGAQKKVEEHHFDMRKNLLEYDEVMDAQRKRIYGFRQGVLDNHNPKILILTMIEKQISQATKKYLDPSYGPASFAEFVKTRLGVEFTPGDFRNCDFEQAERVARDRAQQHIATVIQDAMDENLPEDDDPREWKWQAMVSTMNSKYGLKFTDRELKQIGRENLSTHLLEAAETAVEEVDLTGGQPFLEADWGRRSVCDWVRLKFQLRITPEELADLPQEVVAQLLDRVRQLYREREATFPVLVAMTTYMNERAQPGVPLSQRMDRDGLFGWARARLASVTNELLIDDFRTLPRSKINEMLLACSRRYLPEHGESSIDAKLADAFEGTRLSEADDATELSAWAKETLKLEVSAEQLTGKTLEEARHVLWNAYDMRYRPEMHRMERNLLLDRLDNAWKKHLLTMDHLRAGIGLMGYGQIDPKTEYKKQGMKEFDQMWESLQDQITDAVFRMEEESDFQQSIWAGATAVHAPVESVPESVSVSASQQESMMQTNAAGSEKKAEPIRNVGQRVGRNDPCPCGSGKKYKNCHMKMNPQKK